MGTEQGGSCATAKSRFHRERRAEGRRAGMPVPLPGLARVATPTSPIANRGWDDSVARERWGLGSIADLGIFQEGRGGTRSKTWENESNEQAGPNLVHGIGGCLWQSGIGLQMWERNVLGTGQAHTPLLMAFGQQSGSGIRPLIQPRLGRWGKAKSCEYKSRPVIGAFLLSQASLGAILFSGLTTCVSSAFVLTERGLSLV